MVVWTGILSDWELSKPVDSQEAASKATQADRMVRSSHLLQSLCPLTIACNRELTSSCP